MNCYSCRKYDNCELPWKCSSTMYGCSAYELEQTNEEWIKQCTTEQLAEFLFRVWENGYHSTIDIRIPFNIPFNTKWLKQTHKE